MAHRQPIWRPSGAWAAYVARPTLRESYAGKHSNTRIGPIT